MAKHNNKGGPRICQGCGEWFDAVGAEKVCVNDACADLAARIMKEAREHEAEVKRYYTPGSNVSIGDQNRVYDHQNWRDNHRPAVGAPRARAREEVLREGGGPNVNHWRNVVADFNAPAARVPLERFLEEQARMMQAQQAVVAMQGNFQGGNNNFVLRDPFNAAPAPRPAPPVVEEEDDE